MSKPRWGLESMPDGSWEWLAYDIDADWHFSIDKREGFQAYFVDAPIGPVRKTLKAAHNDCKRYAARLRAALVQFGRAKLP